MFRHVAAVLGVTLAVVSSSACSDDGGASSDGAGGAGAGGASSGGAGAGGASSGGASTGGAPGSGGATGGAAGAGAGAAGAGGGSTGEYCRPKFTSGVNVAWFNFAQDVPNPPIARFTELFNTITPVGGKVVRWWLHTDGRVTPSYDAEGFAEPMPADQIEDIRSILDAAEEAGVMMVISIWGFDMLQNHHGDDSVPANNRLLLTSDAHRQAYIDNVLTPMVTALRGHKGLYAWEIFNEPEGMSEEHGWIHDSSLEVSMEVIQKNVNWMAAAIHEADPEALVTNSAWTFITNSNLPQEGWTNHYSDAELIRVGGKANGTLDFYEVHYYDNWSTWANAEKTQVNEQNNERVSPFTHPVSHWNLDKPVAIGEFWALDVIYSGDHLAEDMYVKLYENGYSGAWAWQYANVDGSDAPGYSTNGRVDATWPTMETPMRKLLEVAGDDLDCQ